ncbi:MAG: ATP F0F1 synthase subunit B [Alphaproteobacteria bacterium]|nr:MAG: ATP F0F1 synthase subunit B [Alphaproteobacteria bacterium]
MKRVLTLAGMLAASPALASEESVPFFSMQNHELFVVIAFIIFVGALLYFGLPGMITGMLDRRAEAIEAELAEARKLREEAQAILAEYERKQSEVDEEANKIIEHAKHEAEAAAKLAKEQLAESIARRLAAATDQIKSAEAAAVREVRNSAVSVAIGAAEELIAKQMTAAEGNKLIDEAIADVEAKLH